MFRNYSVLVQAVTLTQEGPIVSVELRGALSEVVERTFSDVPMVPPEEVDTVGDSTTTITISLPSHTYIDTGDVV